MMRYALAWLAGAAGRELAGFSLDSKAMAELDGKCSEKSVDDDCVCDLYSYKYKGSVCTACQDTQLWGYGCRLRCPPGACRWNCDFAGSCQLNICPEGCKAQKRNQEVAARSRENNGPDGCLNERGECEACERGMWGLWCEAECSPNCEESVEGVCDRKGNCFNSCKTGWYGSNCSLACPEACPSCLQFETELGGQMLPAGSCKQACQNRDGSPLDNFGMTCEKPCPGNCDKGILQGVNGRPSCERATGVCLACQPGWWGDMCDKACPQGCMGDRCDQQEGKCVLGCDLDHWGVDCENTCPQFTKDGCDRGTGKPNNCEATRFPSYLEGQGVCSMCPETCRSQYCDKNGMCTVHGCENGFWGEACEKRCPDGCSAACTQDGGECVADVPVSVHTEDERKELDDATEYIPSTNCNKQRTKDPIVLDGLDIPVGTELLGKGDMQGKTKSKIGWLDTSGPGAKIFFRFPPCKPGWTGLNCNIPCHLTCSICVQFREVEGRKLPGNTEDDCLACQDIHPSTLLKTGPARCECITDATRQQNGKCVCDPPDDTKRYSKFDMGRRPPATKRCRTPCRRGTQEAFGEDKSAVCLGNAVVRMMYKNDKKILARTEHACPKGQWQVDDDGKVCVRADYAKYILHDEDDFSFLEGGSRRERFFKELAQASSGHYASLDEDDETVEPEDNWHHWRQLAFAEEGTEADMSRNCPSPQPAPVAPPAPAPPLSANRCFTTSCCEAQRSRLACVRKDGCSWDELRCQYDLPESAKGGRRIDIDIRVHDGMSNKPVRGAKVTTLQVPVLEAAKAEHITDSAGSIRNFATTSKSQIEIQVVAPGYEKADTMFLASSCDEATRVCPPIFLSPSLKGIWDQDRCNPTGSEWEARAILRWGRDPSDLDTYSKDLSGSCKTPADKITKQWVMWRSHNDPESDPQGIQHRPTCKQPEGGSITLDFDVTDGMGPETMTFSSLKPGNYIYAVHRYDGEPEGDLGQSNAVVDVYIGRQHFMCRMDATDCGAKTGDMWVPFELVVTDTGSKDFINGGKEVYKVAVRGGKGAGGVPLSSVLPLPTINAPRDEVSRKAGGRLARSPCEDVFSTACRNWWDSRKICRGGCVEVPQYCQA